MSYPPHSARYGAPRTGPLALAVVTVSIVLLSACGKRPLTTDSAGDSSKRVAVRQQPNGNCLFTATVVQSANGYYRECTAVPGKEIDCRFDPDHGEYVQLRGYPNDQGLIRVNFGEAYNGDERVYSNGQPLPPLTLSDGSDGRTNCNEALIGGSDADEDTLGCTVRLIRIYQSGCTQSRAK